jgi:hypothetical protein
MFTCGVVGPLGSAVPVEPAPGVEPADAGGLVVGVCAGASAAEARKIDIGTTTARAIAVASSGLRSGVAVRWAGAISGT